MQLDALNGNSGHKLHERFVDHGTTENAFNNRATTVHRDQVLITRLRRFPNQPGAQAILPCPGVEDSGEHIGRVKTEGASCPAEQTF